MHPEADALLDAIFADPDDDTPRLVYADWLEEHAQANYAQFIRLQCAAARHKFWTPAANDLWEQIGRVWRELAEEWRLILANFPDVDAVDFSRGAYHQRLGFRGVDDLETFTRQEWNWFPDTVLCAVECDVASLEYDAHDESVLQLYETRYLDRFHAIKVVDAVIPRSLRRERLPRLRHLDLVEARVGASFVETLSRSDRVARLQRLRVSADLAADTFACGVLHTRFGPAVEFVRPRS